MAIDEGSRHRLYRKLDQVLGTEEAGTLMTLLPPTGFEWSQLVTRDNLLATRDDLRLAMDALRHELHADMERLARRVIMWTSTMMVAVAALAFAAGRFV
jgi:hypothetical protein